MINSRPPIKYHCTHAHWQFDRVIEWLDCICGGGRTLPATWNSFSPAPSHVLAAHHTALRLAVRARQSVLLVTTQLTCFEAVRRLMLEAEYPQPSYFAKGYLFEVDFDLLVILAKKIQNAQFHIWEPMELNAEELYEWLALFCSETGVQTVVVDDPLMFSGMSGNQSWVKLANHLNVEIMLYRPIEPSGSLGI